MGKKNASGKYRGRVQIGNDENGKPINKYVCACTKQELEVRKEEMVPGTYDYRNLGNQLPWASISSSTIFTMSSRLSSAAVCGSSMAAW